MTDDAARQAPSPDAPPPARRRGTEAARMRGAPPAGAAMPRMETVRITAPDLARRAALDRTRNRLVFTAGGFFLLFGAVAAKLTSATVLFPMAPSRAEMRPLVPADPGPTAPDSVPLAEGAPHTRATILDRNGEILAISLPTAALFANPKEMIDTAEAAHKLKGVLPRLDEKQAALRLASAKQFVYLERQITPNEELAINALGIPGVYFQPGEKRRYPLGRVAAQVLGGVDVDSHGVAGAERAFDKRLESETSPVRLSIDVRVQGVMRDELEKSKDEFHAIGACGIVMDVRTGEVIAMVSLPDYDANQFGETPPDDRFNRAVTGMFEPGSTFKLQTAAMALDFGSAHIWDEFDAAHNIHIGRFTIVDYKGKHRFLYLPEVLAYSSNLGAAHVALGVGAQRQQTWLQAMGMFRKVGVELPEAGWPIVPPRSNWKEATTMTVGFGHGIAVSPLHVVRGTAALANGGIVLQPTILAHDPADPLPEGRRIMNLSTSDTIRKMMRLVVTDGYGKPADIAGLFRRRQDRHGREGRCARLQETRQRQRVHERVPDERAALRGVFHARRAGGQQGDSRLRHGRRGERAGCRPGHRPHRADARTVPADTGRGGDTGRAGHPDAAGARQRRAHRHRQPARSAGAAAPRHRLSAGHAGAPRPAGAAARGIAANPRIRGLRCARSLTSPSGPA